jgi:hypothetical protein
MAGVEEQRVEKRSGVLLSGRSPTGEDPSAATHDRRVNGSGLVRRR